MKARGSTDPKVGKDHDDQTKILRAKMKIRSRRRTSPSSLRSRKIRRKKYMTLRAK